MKRVALVFRTVGERTSELSLALARQHIRPDEEVIIEDARPFTEAVRRMVAHEYESDLVVAVDADSLILEDMRSWLNLNDQPYVDCYVNDRFRGRIHCGVHITRVDVMREMARIEPPGDDLAYVLRPESRLRKLAMNRLGVFKSFKSFRILHDHFQFLNDVWAKYALRELRSRTPEQHRKLEAAMERWNHDVSNLDYRVARDAVAWAREAVPVDSSPEQISKVIASLPERGRRRLESFSIAERGELAYDDVQTVASSLPSFWPPADPGVKVFGLGLSRTGTRSLTAALHVLGIDTVHYPVVPDVLHALTSGDLNFDLLKYFDGITDITVSPYFRELDKLYPDAKFILTVREETGWLKSCDNHWRGRPPRTDSSSDGIQLHMKIRRFLRQAVYGGYDFEPDRFRRVYRAHCDAVREYFSTRPGKLLELDIVAGEGWEPLCEFLGRPTPPQPFPHKGGGLSAKLAASVDDPDD